MDNQSQFFYSSIFKISISPKNYHFSSLDWAFKLICEKSGFTPDDLIEVDHIIPKSKGGKDEFNNRPLAKVFHGMIKSYLFLELATVVKRSLSEIAVRQHSRSETASK